MKGFSRRHLLPMAAVAVTAGGFGGIASQAMASGETLTGAGSTLVAPFEAEWAQGFDQKTGNSVQYAAVGSGTGITDISQRTVQFGASDAPLDASQAQACNNCTQIPWALAATGIGYNVRGVGHKLRLTPSTLAGIYLGHITNWDASAIRRSNPGIHLPNQKITPIFRSDGSGDTYAFTNYLSDVSRAWHRQVGLGTSVNFPTSDGAVSAKGNSGVAALLQQTPGGIAYIAVSYLISNKLNAAAIQNAAGNYEYPNLTNIDSAASTVSSIPSSNALHIVDPPKSAKVAYPISTFTYAIVPKTGNSNVSLLKSFLDYAITTGQSSHASLDFGTLPNIVVSRDKSTIRSLS